MDLKKNRTLSERTSERKGYYTGTGCRGFWSIRSDGFPMGDGNEYAGSEYSDSDC